MVHYVGLVIYGNDEIYFSFNGKTLKLFPKEEVLEEILDTKKTNMFAMTSERKPLISNVLEGKVFETKEQIVFFINETNYGVNGIVDWTIYIPVYDYIILKHRRNNMEKIKITYYSKEFNRFLDAKINIDFNMNDNKISNIIDVDVSSKNNKARFNIDGIDCEISPTCYISHKNGYELLLGLNFYINTIKIEWKDIIKFTHSLKELVEFLFYRTDICPEKLSICFIEKVGEIVCNHQKEYIPKIEDKNSIWNDSIKWRHSYDIIEKLFRSIYLGNLYNLHIPDSLEDRLVLYIHDIPIISAAFENTFSRVYSDPQIETDERKKAIDAAEGKLNSLIEETRGKEKEIYKNCKKHLHDKRLEDKILYSFNENMESLKWIKSKFAPDDDYVTLASICANNRNQMNHGSKIKLEGIEAHAFGMLRALVLCMQLKLYGMNNENIAFQ